MSQGDSSEQRLLNEADKVLTRSGALDQARAVRALREQLAAAEEELKRIPLLESEVVDLRNELEGTTEWAYAERDAIERGDIEIADLGGELRVAVGRLEKAQAALREVVAYRRAGNLPHDVLESARAVLAELEEPRE